MNKLLVFAEYYYPGYKAGGPIQSLLNIAECIREDFTISVYTSSYDLTAAAPYDQVIPNEWNNIVIRGNGYSIFYKAGRGLRIRSLVRAVRETDTVYLNGIFSFSFFLLPVLVNFFLKKRMIISPRGMLQAGALNVKSKKKRIYLFLLKKSGLLNNAKWHATDPVEKEDIASVFAKNKGIVVLPNLPRKPLPVIATPQKKAGKLNLVYLSLITAKKNLDLLLAAVAKMDNIYLSIYGPVKDVKYWEKKCLPIISGHPDKITYKGDLQPEMVQQTIAAYDVLVLLSSGENFGHALYESLSVGRPVITSPFTPWTDLEIKKAGFNTGINNVSSVIATLERMRLMDQTTYNLFCVQAYREACAYYFGTDFKAGYKKLFTS